MYRNDNYLEIADLKLRLFTEYCKDLPCLYFDAVEISEILKYRQHSTSLIKVECSYKNDILDLIERKDKAWKKYYECRSFIRPIKDILETLNDDEIKLLSYRYEAKLTLREIGKIYNYSYMNISRSIDTILYKFG